MIDTLLTSLKTENQDKLSWKDRVNNSLALLFVSDIIQHRINKLNFKNNIVIAIWLFMVTIVLTLKILGVF